MIGVDEVGRGCIAGPLLVVAARENAPLPKDLRDSKLMSRNQRLQILNLLSICCDFGEGWVMPDEIDNQGLAQAMRLGVDRALISLGALSVDEVILDGHVNYLPEKFINFQCLVDGDALVPIVSAASVYAKVTRDNFMIELSKKHTGYGFEKHVGYFTVQHRAAIKNHGPLEGIHRMSFQPLRGRG